MANTVWVRRCRILKHIMRTGRITNREARRITGESDKRTIQRDLEALSDHAGVQWVDAGQGSYWALAPDERMMGLPVSLQDRLAMRVGHEFVRSFLYQTDFSESVERMDRAMLELDPDSDVTRDALSRRFHFIHEPEKDYTAHRELLSRLTRALLETRLVSFEYSTMRGSKQHSSVRPYTLVVYKRGLYLVARTSRPDPTVFRVEKISNLEVSDHQFEYPYASQWDPDTHFGSCFGIFPNGDPQDVRLRFTGNAVDYARSRVWMAGQEVIDFEDACEVRFAATGRELESLALQFGELVEVLEPESLRVRVAERLALAAALYE